MTLDYLYSVQSQETAYIATEKMVNKGGTTMRHGFVKDRYIKEAAHGLDEHKITESWLDIMLFTPYHR